MFYQNIAVCQVYLRIRGIVLDGEVLNDFQMALQNCSTTFVNLNIYCFSQKKFEVHTELQNRMQKLLFQISIIYIKAFKCTSISRKSSVPRFVLNKQYLLLPDD